MTVDPLFPFPEPSFLWVHELTRHVPSGDPIPDETGYWTSDNIPTTDTPNIPCYVGAYNPSQQEAGDTYEESVDAVALVSHSTPFNRKDEVTVTAAAAYLLGRYRVSVVRPNPSHQRLLLTRVPERESA